MNKIKFIKKIETMIKPIDIATLQLLAPLTKFVPNKLQNAFIEKSAKKNPYMGFVVEPYSIFLCYELKDIKWAKKMIPDGFEPIKTKIFESDQPKYYLIFCNFNVHTSAFSGSRLEVNIIAENKRTGLLSWVILDYDTNTLSHDPLKGVVGSTTSHAIHTTDFDGNIIVDIQNKKQKRDLIFTAQTINHKKRDLDQRLWLEGNLSVAYGRKLSRNSDKSFSLKFDPREVKEAYEIFKDDIEIEENSWFKGHFDPEVKKIVYFPYAQHYLADSPGHFSNIKNQNEMVESIERLKLDKIPDYSAKSHRKMFLGGMVLNAFIMILMLILLLNKK